jgi:MFS family permease
MSPERADGRTLTASDSRPPRLGTACSMAERKRARKLGPGGRRLLFVLGLPTLATAFSTTAVSTYLPVVARRFTGSTTVIGVIIVGEGLMALVVPLLSGSASDRFRSRGGSRLAFVVAGVPVIVVGLVALGFVSSLVLMGLLVAAFFAGSFFSYEPYRALYPDLLPDEQAGRAQATQAVWRGTGTILALAAGGVMLSVWRGLPFVVGAALQTAAIAALLVLLPLVSAEARSRIKVPRPGDLRADVAGLVGKLRALLGRERQLRAYLVANCLWELSLGAVKTFVILYVTAGLGHSLAAASLIVGAVAVVILLGAIASGKLADRVGSVRTMRVGLWLYGVALAVPIFVHTPAALLPVVPVIAFGGGMTMTLPYAILMPLMPEDSHGLLTGFYSLSRGLGVMLGPLLAGAAIQLLGGDFPATHGYAAMWIVASGSILASIPLLSKLRSRSQAGGERRRSQEGWAEVWKDRVLSVLGR